MSEVAVRIDAISDELFEFGGFGEALRLRTREQELACETHLEDATAAWYERNLTQIVRERAQQLLCDPSRSQ